MRGDSWDLQKGISMTSQHTESKEGKEWGTLKQFLLATHEEYSDRNGLDSCKNCGVSMQDLVEEFERLLAQAKKMGREEALITVDNLVSDAKEKYMTGWDSRTSPEILFDDLRKKIFKLLNESK